MSKIIIEISDEKESVVAGMGVGMLEKIADREGYMEMVANPAYEEGKNEEFISNPEGRTEWLGRFYLETLIVPRLVSFDREVARKQAIESAELVMKGKEALMTEATNVSIF